MKRFILYIGIGMLMWLLGACERRPLITPNNTHYVRVYVDEKLLNVTEGFYNDDYVKPSYRSPDVLRLVLADPLTGAAKAERFLRNIGKDEKGTYYDGHIIADPGDYTLLAYNFDTETTIVKDANSHPEAKATTNEIASHLRASIPSRYSRGENGEIIFSDETIVYEPDHLFAANCGEIRIPYVEQLDTLRTPSGEYFTAQSIVKSYYLQVRVKGMKFATSSVGLLTGLSGSAWLDGKGMDTTNPVTLYFELMPGEGNGAGKTQADENDIVTLYTTFSTFGKLPEVQNKLEITFDFITVYDEVYSETLDITHLFSTKEALEHQWLLIDHTLVVPEPPEVGGDGGFKPDVEEWDDIFSDIII